MRIVQSPLHFKQRLVDAGDDFKVDFTVNFLARSVEDEHKNWAVGLGDLFSAVLAFSR